LFLLFLCFLITYVIEQCDNTGRPFCQYYTNIIYTFDHKILQI